MKSAAVFVYGDIGRSPRMQNHAVELSKMYQVYFMGYFETTPKSRVMENGNIHIVDLQIKNLQIFRAISFYLYAFVRIVLQILQILYLMGWKYRNVDFILVQVKIILFRTLHQFPIYSLFGSPLSFRNTKFISIFTTTATPSYNWTSRIESLSNWLHYTKEYLQGEPISSSVFLTKWKMTSELIGTSMP